MSDKLLPLYATHKGANVPDLNALEKANKLILLHADCIALLIDGGKVDISFFPPKRSDAYTMCDRLRDGGFEPEETQELSSSTSYMYSSSDGTIEVTIFVNHRTEE